jgi:hypothetical protein
VPARHRTADASDLLLQCAALLASEQHRQAGSGLSAPAGLCAPVNLLPPRYSTQRCGLVAASSGGSVPVSALYMTDSQVRRVRLRQRRRQCTWQPRCSVLQANKNTCEIQVQICNDCIEGLDASDMTVLGWQHTALTSSTGRYGQRAWPATPWTSPRASNGPLPSRKCVLRQH